MIRWAWTAMELSWVMSTTVLPGGVELLQHGQHLPAGVGVQGAGGLIRQDHRRVPGQGPGNGHPLLLAAGELAGLVL